MKNKILLIFIFFLCLYLPATTQQHDYNWIFGEYSYPDEENTNGNILNFVADTVSISIYEKNDQMQFYSTTYSDAAGKLRFWSNGCELFDADANIMDNGDTLNPGLIYEDWCSEGESLGYLGPHQSMLSLPNLNDDRYVFVFHTWVPWNSLITPFELKYSIVDMEANEGLGSVIEKGTFLETNVSIGLLAATKSLDLSSWWIVCPERNTPNHFIFQLEGDSVYDAKVYDQGFELTDDNASSSASAFSPDGTKYAIFGEENGLRIYDFDRAAGELSNYQYIEAPGDYSDGWVGLDFSSSGRFLYTCHFRKIYQYDMNAENIGASRVTVADWIEHADPFFSFVPTPFFKMQRAPDCRIYLSAQNGTKTMHVIHYPDRKGTACMVQQNITIPAYNFMTLPNFPNYRLDTGEVCDSTKVFPMGLLNTATATAVPLDFDLNVFPNPSTGVFNIVIGQQLSAPLNFSLSTLDGRKVFQQKIERYQDAETFDFSHLPIGMYIYTFTYENRIAKTEKIVLIR